MMGNNREEAPNEEDRRGKQGTKKGSRMREVTSIQNSGTNPHKKCYTTSSREGKDQLSLAPTAESSSSVTSLSPMVTQSSSSLRSSSSQHAGLRLYNQGLEKMKRLERKRREQEERSVKKEYSLNKSSKPSSSIRAGLRLYNLAAEKQKKFDAMRKNKIQIEEKTAPMSKTVSTREKKETKMQNTPTPKPRYEQMYGLGKDKKNQHRFHVVIYDESSNGGCNRGAINGLKHDTWNTSSCHSFSFFKCF